MKSYSKYRITIKWYCTN